MVKWASSLILGINLIAASCWSYPADLSCRPNITLSQKDVSELVLKQGRKTQEANLQSQALRLELVKIQSAYQWNLTMTSGYLFDKSANFSTSSYDKQETLVSNLLLSKNFTTGTLASVEYKRTSFKGELNSTGSTLGSRSLQTQDLLGLNVEQNIWANAFGYADRRNVESAELAYKAKSVLRTNELENIVLETIRLFWKTYVSERNFSEAMASRDRSKKLVDAVKKKSGFGYANPGELSQAQADYEGRVQDVKNTSTAYLENIDALNTALNLPQNCEIKFAISEIIPSIPQLPEKSVEDLRQIKSQRLSVSAAQNAYESSQSTDDVSVKLVGKIYTYGVDQEASGAYNNMVSGSHPQYYAGVKVEAALGADLAVENRLNRKYLRDIEQIRLSRMTQETSDLLLQSQRKAQAAYSAVLSATEQKKFREKALKELNRSFGQGRTDISIYIDAMNKFSVSEIQYSQAIGNYQTALNEWAAARDALIPMSPEDQ